VISHPQYSSVEDGHGDDTAHQFFLFHFQVTPDETALAFFKARNPTDRSVIGIRTYNVVPFEAGQHFNKIQCFSFEEQQLNPQEEVDKITLSYTFFEAK